MNWVGGSRSRCMKHREDMIKQRAYFQKQRMKTKSNNLDPQTLPNGNNTGNVDLLTLFIVNQIASKKHHTGTPKINCLMQKNGKDTNKTLNEPLELPMSPCSPSDLNLAASQPQYSIDTPGFKVRKQRISEEFRFKSLSPVPESNLSEASGSDSQSHILNTISLFSSASPDIPEPFSIQPRPASHVSSSLPCRENLDHDSMEFVPFSQPMKSASLWTEKSKEAHVLQNSITLPNFKGPSPLKSNEQQEEPLFIDFSNRDCEENPHIEKPRKIFLEPSLSSSTRVHDGSQNMDFDGHFLTQASACTDCNTLGAVDGNGFMSDGDSSEGSLSSVDEKDDQCVHCPCSNKQIRHPEGDLITKHCCLSVTNSKAIPSQAPSCKQKEKCNCHCQNETEVQSHNGNTGKPPKITQDAGTQTAAVSCCDVSVQCSLIYTDSPSKSITFSTDDYKSSVLTTRRQSVHFNELLTPTAISSGKVGHTGAENVQSEAATTETHSKLPEDFSFRKPHQQVTKKALTPILKRPLRKGLELKVGQPLESRVKIERCEDTHLESVMRNPVKDVRRAGESVKMKNYTAEKGANCVPEETEKAEKTADTLLTLKRKEKTIKRLKKQ